MPDTDLAPSPTINIPPAPAMRIPFAACPLCESRSIDDYLTSDCSRHALYQPALPAEMYWKRCASCGHVFIDGYFTPEAATLIFGATNELQEVGHDLERQRQVSAGIIEQVLPYIDHGVWLDIGFGNGSLLFTAQEYGFLPVGMDLREQLVVSMKSLGIEAHCGNLTALSLARPASVISMCDVMEHMPDPKGGLRAAHRLLAKKGVLFISMPNMESMLWRALDVSKVNPYWGEIEHYHNFSRSRLYSLLRECGFEPLKYGVSKRYRACMEVIARKA